MNQSRSRRLSRDSSPEIITGENALDDLLTWGGQFRLQQEANKRLVVVVPITLLLVFLLLYSSFGSLKNSLLILLNIPLALVGGIVALWITGQNLSVPSSVGFIALFGIALENGMVLVTYLNQLVREGVPVDQASVRGATRRMRPVLNDRRHHRSGPDPAAHRHRHRQRGPAPAGHRRHRGAGDLHDADAADSIPSFELE